MLKSRNRLVLTILEQDVFAASHERRQHLHISRQPQSGDFYNSHVDRMLNITGGRWHGLCYMLVFTIKLKIIENL